MKAIFHTEDLNSYGFWILMSGLDLSRYKKNPVLLYNHDGSIMSVGRVNNLRVENNQLVGEVEFDEQDPIGKELKRKYEKGYMAGFSIGFKPVEWSDDEKYIKQGQRYSTVIKSELYEISATNIPSNQNAIKMYSADGLQLNINSNETLLKYQLNKKTKQMKEIALSLGLSADATEQQIVEAIGKLKAEAENAKETKAKLTETVLSIGKDKGVVNAENEADFKQLANTNPELAMKLFAQQKSEQKAPQEQETKLSDVINQNSRPAAKAKKWDELSESELQELREKNLKEYKRLFAEHYGYEPVIE